MKKRDREAIFDPRDGGRESTQGEVARQSLTPEMVIAEQSRKGEIAKQSLTPEMVVAEQPRKGEITRQSLTLEMVVAGQLRKGETAKQSLTPEEILTEQLMNKEIEMVAKQTLGLLRKRSREGRTVTEQPLKREAADRPLLLGVTLDPWERS